MAERFNIVFEGKILEGRSREDVQERMMKLLKIDSRGIDRLFSTSPTVVRKDVDVTTARRYQKVFEAAGAVCHLEPTGPPEDPSLSDIDDWDYVESSAADTSAAGAAAFSPIGATPPPQAPPPSPARETAPSGSKAFVKTFDGGKMILTNVEGVPGYNIVEHFGLVSGSTIRAKHIGRDIMASLKNLIGGEIKGYTKLLQESRDEAIDRMVAQARQMGANAVVNIRFSTSSVAQGAAELYAYGTAVRVE